MHVPLVKTGSTHSAGKLQNWSVNMIVKEVNECHGHANHAVLQQVPGK